ncbi:SDR family NAD(P)-dependent oxidoreductase [Gulosibacter sp. ACHW.36C]|uniref:SDR family oxidoreductase n=1 Tax=Gulosibacter sediminis TaxID=1729695 RepID=A0ABY4MYM7_9MICO|nr:SDR family oxidoreductase [Gulosibacter sediminis]UQN14486.1 SDR family oxidoreductase [Gulosibacter sediminis]
MKSAIVTGSTSGIGKATALRLYERGYGIVFNGYRTQQQGDELVAQLGERAAYVDGDVGDSSVAALLRDRALAEFGRLDLVVNNAGIAKPIPHPDLQAVEDDFWDTVMRTNLKGPWNLVRACAGALAEAKGQVINVASIAGLSVDGSSIPYAVSKAGVIHLTKLLAVALGPSVRVNAIAPGYVDTPLTNSWTAARERILATAPAGRLGEVEDAAQAILALADLGYVTGQILAVDGGVSLV